jgi:hypothetical protein
MSDTVIRNAIIKLAIQLTTPNLNVPNLEPAIKQQEALAEAIKASNSANSTAADLDSAVTKARAGLSAETSNATRQIDINSIAAKGAGESWEEYSERVNAAIGKQAVITPATEKLTEAVQKLNAVNEASLGPQERKTAAGVADVAAVQTAATAQSTLTASQAAGIAVTKSATAAYTGLGVSIKAAKAAMNPIIGTVAAITLGAHLLSRAWDAVTTSEEEAAAAGDKWLQYANRMLSLDFKKIDHLETLAEKEKALRGIVNDPTAQYFKPKYSEMAQIDGAERLLGVYKEQKRAIEDERKSRLDNIELGERELKTARDALRIEQDKDRTLRASIGALNAGEQRKLDRLVSKVEGGGELSKKESLEISKLGGDVGQEVGEKFLAAMDKGLGLRLEKLSGAAAKLTAAQSDFDRRQKSFNGTTGGKSAEDAAKSADNAAEVLSAGIDRMADKVEASMIKFIERLEKSETEQKNQRNAARMKWGSLGG